jgi:hypothetical protein
MPYLIIESPLYLAAEIDFFCLDIIVELTLDIMSYDNTVAFLVLDKNKHKKIELGVFLVV